MNIKFKYQIYKDSKGIKHIKQLSNKDSFPIILCGIEQDVPNKSTDSILFDDINNFIAQIDCPNCLKKLEK